MTEFNAAFPVYPITPQHPPLRVKVVVQWRGRVFVAMRDTHPKSGQPRWVTTKANFEMWYLPPHHDAKLAEPQWGPNPDYFQPLKPEAWRAPLPPPLTARIDATPRLVDISRRRRTRREPHLATEGKVPWWWDATAIVYDPPGRVTLAMAEGRLMRALQVSGAGSWSGMPTGRLQAEAFKDIAEAVAAAEREAKEVRPVRERLALGPYDHKDWLVAMEWFTALGHDVVDNVTRLTWNLSERQLVLIYRAQRLSWSRLAKMEDLSIARVRELYETAVERAWRVANGGPSAGAHKIRRLRESNRAFKRRREFV